MTYTAFNELPYTRKIWQGIKFVSLAVYITTAKLKSANILVIGFLALENSNFVHVHIQTMSAKWRHRDRDGYHSDEYSDDDYTDQDDYTDCDDSGSEYDDEWLVYDNSGGDSGSEYSWEDTIYLNDNIRSWHTRYSYQRSSYGANRRTNDRAASMPPISYGRAKSEREKFTSPRNRRAATCEPRLLFAPTPGAKSSVAKGREFEDYFKMGVGRARGNITSKVEFQKKLNVTPG